MELSTNITKAREQSNLTKTELADATSMSVSAISRYESGEKTPSLAVMKKISLALHKPIYWFYMDEAEQEKWEKEAQLNSYQVENFAQKSEIEQKFALEALELFKKYTE